MKTIPVWTDWKSAITEGIASVSDDILHQVADIIKRADLVLCAGNGGSSALASHAAQAIAKPSYVSEGGRAAVCLSDNVPLLTAHTNDGGYPTAFLETARPYINTVKKLALLLISSSGKSENIVALAKFARERWLPVISLTGFEGEPLKSLATLSLHVSSFDYEVVEPVHDALIHRIQFHLRGPS